MKTVWWEVMTGVHIGITLGLLAVFIVGFNEINDLTTRLDALEAEERIVEIYYHNVDPDTMVAVERSWSGTVYIGTIKPGESVGVEIEVPLYDSFPPVDSGDSITPIIRWFKPHIIPLPPVELPEKGGPK